MLDTITTTINKRKDEMIEDIIKPTNRAEAFAQWQNNMTAQLIAVSAYSKKIQVKSPWFNRPADYEETLTVNINGKCNHEGAELGHFTMDPEDQSDYQCDKCDAWLSYEGWVTP